MIIQKQASYSYPFFFFFFFFSFFDRKDFSKSNVDDFLLNIFIATLLCNTLTYSKKKKTKMLSQAAFQENLA